MSKIDLSIIIPVYNAEKYLKDCLDSILKQTYKNIEIICINDCSKDNSLDILNEYGSCYPFIKIINNISNLGPGASRNIGIKCAQGKYLTFIDADDFYLSENCFSELMQKVETYNLDLLIFNNKEFDENTQSFIPEKQKRFKFPYSKKFYNHVWSKSEIEKHYFNIIPFPCSKIYLKEMLTKNRIYFPEGIYYEDAAFSNYVSLFNTRVMVLDEAYYAYRVNVSTSTTQNIMSKFDSIIQMHIEMLNFLRERNIYEKFYVSFVNLCISSLCFYFLPQINNIEKSEELNLQIADFINRLALSDEKLKEIRKENPYTVYIINLYKKRQIKKFQNASELRILGLLLLKCIDYIKYKQFFLFNFIPVYKIYYKKANCAVHYLFNVFPYIKVKNDIVYLLMFIPVVSLRKFSFFKENYEYELYKTKERNK